MQSKKFVNNPEAAIFNIRKVNKKAIGLGKNLGDQVYYTPEADHEKDITFQNYSSLFHSEVIDQRKQKQIMLDQTVSEAIINSKAYGDLKRTHIESKKKNAQQKQLLQINIDKKKKQKVEAMKEQKKLQEEKEKYLQAIASMKEKIDAVREANDRYREALSNRMPGGSEYISNLIMSMRFQAEYEHNIDPDQMTYEQLLELQEKIGVVCRGLPPEIIGLLPKTEIVEQTEEKCMVCFSVYEEGEVKTVIPNCKHDFHFECLESWLGKEKVCPLCKQEVEIPE